MIQATAKPSALQVFQRSQGLVGLALVLIVAALVSRDFYTADNFANILRQVAVPGTLAVGMTFVILTGGIDLSVGSHLALLNVVLASWLKNEAPLSVALSYVLGLGTAIGAGVGWLIGASRMQPFVVTLAAMVTLRGVSYLYSSGAFVSGFGNAAGFFEETHLGLTVSGWLLILCTLIAGIALSKTVFGRQVYAVGGSEKAARYAGVPISRVKVGAYAVNGLCVALAAIMFTARTHSGQPSSGVGFELDAIAAVVVGGSALSGGVGNVFGTLVGAMFIGCLNTLLQLKGVDSYVAMGWKGVVILIAVYLQTLGRRTEE